MAAFGAGKTTLITNTLIPNRNMSKRTVPEGQPPLRWISAGSRKTDCHIHIFGTPGQERFEFAREIIATGMDGAILLVDATAPLDDFTRHLSDSLHAAKVPFVVFLNKCEIAGADPCGFAGKIGSSNGIRQVSAVNQQQCLEAVIQFAGTLPAHSG